MKGYSFKDLRKPLCHATLANRMNIGGEKVEDIAKELNIEVKILRRKMRNNGFYFDEHEQRWGYIPATW
ncbi:hypothetical protein [Bacillus tropicus]|uniref:hypothetical protein n=1 Tax=Bacillus tropicus TaxID=2026188 RepID=UPI0018CC9BB4|nr:hypothetical protein [Bacillus tropicus]MBG9876678.1 hypothetical protein [Bacillus tropicus]